MVTRPQPVARFPEVSKVELGLMDLRSGHVLTRSTDPRRISYILSMLMVRKEGLPEDYRVICEAPTEVTEDIYRQAKDFDDLGKEFCSPVRLTKRETEVLSGIHRLLSNKEISNEINISERTVKYHMNKLLFKYQVDCRAKLLRITS